MLTGGGGRWRYRSTAGADLMREYVDTNAVFRLVTDLRFEDPRVPSPRLMIIKVSRHQRHRQGSRGWARVGGEGGGERGHSTVEGFSLSPPEVD